MENKEDILDALNDFDKKTCTEIPPLLEQYLQQVAKTGKTWFPWNKLKKLFLTKVDNVMSQFKKDSPTDLLQTAPNVEQVKYEDMRKRILTLMEEFQGAPFTVQRLCELIIEPKRHYKRCDKFLRGIEKNVSVVSTVDPFGRKIVSESQAMVNGLDSNGVNETLSKPNPFSSFPTPTQSAWTASIDKWFGSSNTDQGISNKELSGDNSVDSSEEKENLTSDLCDMETSGTSSSDGDSNDEDVFTNSSSSPEPKQNEEKNDNPDVEESRNTSHEGKISEKSEFLKKESSEEKPDDLHQQESKISSQETESSEEILPSISDNKNKSTTNKTDHPEKTSTSKTSEQLSPEKTVDEPNEDDHRQKGDSALDICENAQSILDSVNKACCDAEEAFSIAQQVCDKDQKEQEIDNADKQTAESYVKESLEHSVEQSTQNTDQQSLDSCDEQSAEKSTLDSANSVDPHTKEILSETEQSDLKLPQENSECDEANTDLDHEPSECGDFAGQAKKPRLQSSEASESESMDVDSSECSDNSSSNALSTNEPTVSVAKSDSEEQARLEQVAQVNSSEDTPMEQD